MVVVVITIRPSNDIAKGQHQFTMKTVESITTIFTLLSGDIIKKEIILLKNNGIYLTQPCYLGVIHLINPNPNNNSK